MRVIRRASMSDETSEGNYKTGVFAIWTEFHRSGGISNLRLRGLLGTENHFHYPSVVSVKQVNQFPVLSGHRSNSAAVVAIKPLPEPLSHDAEGVAHLMEADGGG
jgi:hypothetical protein